MQGRHLEPIAYRVSEVIYLLAKDSIYIMYSILNVEDRFTSLRENSVLTSSKCS